MSLRVQLLAVGVVTLVLPLTAVHFVRVFEDLQREGFEGSLLASATTVAVGLAGQTAVVDALGGLSETDRPQPPCPEGGCAAELAAGSVYAPPLRARPQIDGVREWLDESAALEIGRGHRLFAGVYRDARYAELYLFVAAQDPERIYQSPPGRTPHGDRIVLSTVDEAGQSRSLLLATAAPGAFRAQATTAPAFASTGDFNERVEADWQERPGGGGYVVEIRVPFAAFPAHERLGVAVVDVDPLGGEPVAEGCTESMVDGARASEPPRRYEICVTATWPLEAGRGNEALGHRLPGRLVQREPELQRLLAQYTPAGGRFRIVDREGWVVADAGRAAAAARETQGASIFVELLGMALARNDPALPAEGPLGRLAIPALQRALAGEPETAWYAGSAERNATVVAAVPLRGAPAGAGFELTAAEGPPIGAVILEQTSDPIRTVRNDALARLLGITLFATLVIAAFLLGYATLLSLRVRRLALAAESAVGPRGEIRTDMPGRKARDEIGDLARSFTRLLERAREHTDYLKTLASKLSHELRTPLAVVSTSLDNLEHEPQTANGAQYVARLRDGTARLDAILAAMSEATRLEQAIAEMPFERYDAHAVLESCVRAYRDVYPEREIAYRPLARDPVLHGSPELLAQLLDKLVDNAVGFSPPASRIDVVLEEHGEELGLAVANVGPPLPEIMRTRLFDSFVSVRESSGARPHLGLGLRIVALVAEFHGGRVAAEDLPGGGGVVFRVWFPRRS